MRKVPIHRALTRPPTLMGCDRTLLFFVGIVSLIAIGPAGIGRGNVAMVTLGAVLLLGGTAALAWMGKKDPDMRRVFLRSLLYASRYDACARWDAPEPVLRRYGP